MPASTTSWLHAALACIVATLAACSSPSMQVADTPAPQAAIGVWESPAADYPAMCIVFLPGGELRFQGGFRYFNPARWASSPADGTVRITLGGAARFPFERARYPLAREPGALVELAPEQRALVYRLGAEAASFDFAGFVFYRKAACSAA